MWKELRESLASFAKGTHGAMRGVLAFFGACFLVWGQIAPILPALPDIGAGWLTGSGVLLLVGSTFWAFHETRLRLTALQLRKRNAALLPPHQRERIHRIKELAGRLKAAATRRGPSDDDTIRALLDSLLEEGAGIAEHEAILNATRLYHVMFNVQFMIQRIESGDDAKEEARKAMARAATDNLWLLHWACNETLQAYSDPDED